MRDRGGRGDTRRNVRAQRGMWGVKGDMGDRGGWGTEEEAPGMSGQVHSSAHGRAIAVGRGYPPPPEVDRGSPVCAEPSGGPSWAGRPGLLPFSPQAYGGERLLSQHMSTPPWGPAGCCDQEGQAGGLRKAGSTVDGPGGLCPVPGPGDPVGERPGVGTAVRVEGGGEEGGGWSCPGS